MRHSFSVFTRYSRTTSLLRGEHYLFFCRKSLGTERTVRRCTGPLARDECKRAARNSVSRDSGGKTKECCRPRARPSFHAATSASPPRHHGFRDCHRTDSPAGHCATKGSRTTAREMRTVGEMRTRTRDSARALPSLRPRCASVVDFAYRLMSACVDCAPWYVPL